MLCSLGNADDMSSLEGKVIISEVRQKACFICWTEGCLNDFVTAKYPKDEKYRQNDVAG